MESSLEQNKTDFDDNETTRIVVDLIDRYQCGTFPTGFHSRREWAATRLDLEASSTDKYVGRAGIDSKEN